MEISGGIIKKVENVTKFFKFIINIIQFIRLGIVNSAAVHLHHVWKRVGKQALAAAASPRGGRAEAGVAPLPHLHDPCPLPPDRAALPQAPAARVRRQGGASSAPTSPAEQLAILGAERGAER